MSCQLLKAGPWIRMQWAPLSPSLFLPEAPDCWVSSTMYLEQGYVRLRALSLLTSPVQVINRCYPYSVILIRCGTKMLEVNTIKKQHFLVFQVQRLRQPTGTHTFCEHENREEKRKWFCWKAQPNLPQFSKKGLWVKCCS